MTNIQAQDSAPQLDLEYAMIVKHLSDVSQRSYDT
jgi:hypothetical protein